MKRFLRGLGIFVALVGVGIVSAFAVIALLLRQEEVRVPDLTGRDIVSVIEVVSHQGLLLKVDRRESSITVPKDAIISQTPAGGTELKKGRHVSVVVSLGPSEFQAPKLIGEHFRKADIMIRQAGLFPGSMSRISSEDIERNIVIAQSPQPGSPLDKGGKVNLLISSGKRPQMMMMPKLTGKTPEEAATVMSRMGLQHRASFKPDDNQPVTERRVTQQKPAAGTPVNRDAVVEIVVK